PHETILIAGVNTVSELFIHSVQEFASKIRVAGLLAQDPSLRGLIIHKKPILGTIEELWDILQSLEIHGVSVDRIVVAMPGERLQPHALKTLIDLEKSSSIVVHFLSERLGFEDFSTAPSASLRRKGVAVSSQAAFVLAEDLKRLFWSLKRMVDCFFAAL